MTLPGPLPADEVVPLIAAAQAGDAAARNRVIAHHMRLVHKMAARFARHYGRLDLYDDLVQAGAVGGGERPGGLLRAIDTFDAAKGASFVLHATYWVASSCTRFMGSQRSSVVGACALERQARILRVAERLTRELGRMPTAEEIATVARVSVQMAARTLEVSVIREESIDHRRARLHPTASASEGGVLTSSLADSLVGAGADDVTELVDDVTRMRRVWLAANLPGLLTDRERYVLVCRYKHEPVSYAQLTEVMGVSRQAVQAFEANALRKLREHFAREHPEHPEYAGT